MRPSCLAHAENCSRPNRNPNVPGPRPASGHAVGGDSYSPTMDDQRVRVDEATMRTWAEIALKIRAANHIVHTVSIPESGSAFASTDDLYPTESSSQWGPRTPPVSG